MKAIQISHPGGPEVLVRCERPMPIQGPGQVLIHVAAAGINRPDVLQRSGLYRPPADASDLPGLEVAGTIVEGDTCNSGFSLGDMVCALVPGGGYAEYCIAELAHCLPLPRGWSAVEAASLPETCFTVWSNVLERAKLAWHETVLVQGGSSGIGVTAIQMLKALGHTVYATAGTQEKVHACKHLGADIVINHREQDFAEAINAATDGNGVNVILDMVGGDYVPREISCLADDGRLVLIALLGGSKAEVPLAQVMLRRLTITGSTLRPRSIAYKADIARQLRAKVWPLIDAGKIRPVIHTTFPLENAADAHRLMESGTHIGKIVLRVN